MLKDGDKHNFELLARALDNDDLCLAESRIVETGEYVALICAAEQHEDEVRMMPIAEMIRTNPFEYYADPTTDFEPAVDAVSKPPSKRVCDAIESILAYNWDAEEQDFAHAVRMGDIEPPGSGHVFEALQIVRAYLDGEEA